MGSLLFVGFWFVTSPAAAASGLPATYTVDRWDDEVLATDCLDGVLGDCSLRGAIRRSNLDGVVSTVSVPDGFYDLTIEGPDEQGNDTGDLDIWAGDLTVKAALGSSPTITQTTDDRIFDVLSAAGSVRFEGLHLQGGEARNTGGLETGGSINFRGSVLELENMLLQQGFAADQGGCLSWFPWSGSGSLSIVDATFLGCQTEGAGGGFHISGATSTVFLERVIVSANISGEIGGGGVLFGGSTTVQIVDSSFLVNRADSTFNQSFLGGGLYLGGGSFSIRGTTIAGNLAGGQGAASASGAGLYLNNSQVQFQNSTLSENVANSAFSTGAEAVAASQSLLAFQSSTVVAHVANAQSAIRTVGAEAEVRFSASILRGGCDGSGSIQSQGFNVEHPLAGATSSQCQLSHVSDVLVTQPLLAPFDYYGGFNHTYRLRSAQAGNAFIVPSGSCPPTDQRGAPRNALFCYAGAVEHSALAPGEQIFADGFESADVQAWS